MEHHWVESMLIASFLWVRIEILDGKMSDEYNYDDDDELDFVLRSASLQMNERNFSSSNKFNLEKKEEEEEALVKTLFISPTGYHHIILSSLEEPDGILSFPRILDSTEE